MYTNIPKPTGSDYTRATFQGKRIWDDAGVFYDDPDVFWDGNSVAISYTKIAKPLNSPTWGDLIVSWASYQNPWGIPFYTKVNKPT